MRGGYLAVHRRLGTLGVPRLLHDRGHRRQADRSWDGWPDRIRGGAALGGPSDAPQAEQRELAAYLSAPLTTSVPAPRGPHIGDISRRQLLTYLSTWHGLLAQHPTAGPGRTRNRGLGPRPDGRLVEESDRHWLLYLLFLDEHDTSA